MLLFHRKNLFGYLILTIVLIGALGSNGRSQPPRPIVGKQSSEKLLEQVLEFIRNESFSKAADVLRRVLTAEPKNVAAHTLAGIVADRQNDLRTAEKHFANAARLQPNAPETRNNYGAILLRLKRTSEAAKEFAASLKANPNQPSAQVNLAQIHFEKGTPSDLQAARNLFEKVLQTAPDVEVARALVVIALRLGENERAALDFESYFSFAKNTPQPVAERIELGAELLEQNLNAEAVQELAAAVALDGANVQALILLSRAYLGKKDVKNAGKTLESAVANGIEDAKIYAALAEVYQAGGFIENAIPAMRLAIEKDPTSEIYRARYGMLLIDTKAPAAAIIRLNEAVKIFPKSARIWLALGIAHLIDGQTADAKKSFENSLAIEPKSVPALAYLATVAVEQADYAQGAAMYERALNVEAKNAYLHFLLAETLAKIPSGDAAIIEKHLKQAVEIDPTFAQAHLALGKLEARNSRWQEAAIEFEQAVKYEPESAEGHYQLGRVLTRLKRPNEAQIAFEKHKRLSETQSTKKETDRREYVRRLANVRF